MAKKIDFSDPTELRTWVVDRVQCGFYYNDVDEFLKICRSLEEYVGDYDVSEVVSLTIVSSA